MFLLQNLLKSLKLCFKVIPNRKDLLKERSFEGKTVLEIAVKHRRKPFIKLLFQNGVDPNTKTKDGEYLFYQIAKDRDIEVGVP